MLEWEDLVALGMSASAVVVHEQSGVVSITPEPPPVVYRVIHRCQGLPALQQRPVPRMVYLRAVRDALLDLSDWTQGGDAPLTGQQKASWAQYRAALRALPQVYSGNGPIPWPAIPTA